MLIATLLTLAARAAPAYQPAARPHLAYEISPTDGRARVRFGERTVVLPDTRLHGISVAGGRLCAELDTGELFLIAADGRTERVKVEEFFRGTTIGSMRNASGETLGPFVCCLTEGGRAAIVEILETCELWRLDLATKRATRLLASSRLKKTGSNLDWGAGSNI